MRKEGTLKEALFLTQSWEASHPRHEMRKMSTQSFLFLFPVCLMSVCLSVLLFCIPHKANSGPKAEWWPQSHSLCVWQWWGSGGQMLGRGEVGKGAPGNWMGQDREKVELGGGG